MVSLGGDRRSPGGGGGCSFSDESDEIEDDFLITNVLDVEGSHTKIFPVAMWIVLIIQIISVIGLFICLLLISDIYYLNIFHVVVWAIVFLTCCCLYRYHRLLKCYGYLQFYKKTYVFLLLPFFTLSFGNSILLVFGAILEICCPHSNYCPLNSKMHYRYYSWIAFIMEFIILFPSCIAYTFLVAKFVFSNAVPDIQQDEIFTSSIVSQCPTHEIGFREGDYRDDIMERQTDLIRYLKQHSIHLSKKILKLTEELNLLRAPT